MEILSDQSLSDFTTFRIGGRARWFARPRNVGELREALSFASSEGLKIFTLGGGSNLLIDDAGFDGLVIKLEGDFATLDVDPVEETVTAGGGVRLKKLGRIVSGMGYGGFVFMAGIPGTVGGAVAMNAGTREGDVASVCVWAEVCDYAGKVRRLSADELGFGYRDSHLRREKRLIVTRACFRLGEIGDRQELLARIRESLLERASREPRNRRNCGSVFKAAADGTPAGLLIDRAGLKEARIGDAMIALEHANWIVNMGGAASSDVKALVSLAGERVKQLFGVDLQREVVYLPDDLSDAGFGD